MALSRNTDKIILNSRSFLKSLFYRSVMKCVFYKVVLSAVDILGFHL